MLHLLTSRKLSSSLKQSHLPSAAFSCSFCFCPYFSTSHSHWASSFHSFWSSCGAHHNRVGSSTGCSRSSPWGEGLGSVTGCLSHAWLSTKNYYLHRRPSFLSPLQAPFRLLNSSLKSKDLYLVYESEKLTSTFWNISQQQLSFLLVPNC